MKLNFTATALLGILLSNTAIAQHEDISSRSPYSTNISYVGDVLSNFGGGFDRKTDYLGLAKIQVSFSTEAARCWKGGELVMNLANTHGRIPSDDFVGDFQGVSNIQAGNRTFFQELLYRQTFGKLKATVGILDMNAEFSVNNVGGTFINSSFGLHSTFTDHIAVSVFPNTGLGAVLMVNLDSTNTLQCGIFDGNSSFMTIYPANFEMPFGENSGFMTIAEYGYNSGIGIKEGGFYKLGCYYHSHYQKQVDISESNIKNLYGFYLVGNQRLISKSGNRSMLDAFVQLSYSPVSHNTNPLYAGAGLVLHGCTPINADDELGLSIAYAQFNDLYYRSEKVVELTYKYPFGAHAYLQPDLQYVINPSRFGVATPNALVGILRVGISL